MGDYNNDGFGSQLYSLDGWAAQHRAEAKV